MESRLDYSADPAAPINDHYFSPGDPEITDLYWIQQHAVGTPGLP